MAASEQELVDLASLGESLSSTQLGAALNDWSVAEKIDAGKAVEDLEQHPGFQTIVRLMHEARESALITLIHAPRTVDSSASLQRQLGVVKGLEAFRAAIPTIREKAELAQAERDDAAQRADEERQAAT